MDVASTEGERLLSSRRRALAGSRARDGSGRHDRAAEAARELGEIDAALARIADGTYGTCEICGGAIGRDRLRALPEVRRCLACSASGFSSP